MMASHENNHVLLEHGTLDFAVAYCDTICTLYDVIGYVPPRGDKVVGKNRTLEDCIKEVEPCIELLLGMQDAMEEQYSTRKSFMGPDGMPLTDTIRCVRVTIRSWKVNMARLKMVEQHFSTMTSIDKIYMPAITNEATVDLVTAKNEDITKIKRNISTPNACKL